MGPDCTPKARRKAAELHCAETTNTAQFLILQTHHYTQLRQLHTEPKFKAINQILGDFCIKFSDLLLWLFNFQVPGKKRYDDTQTSKQMSKWQNSKRSRQDLREPDPLPKQL